MAISASRPASIRVLHHTSPPVPMRVTRSPSRTPFFRNSATAILARWACGGARWVVSNRITNVRPVRDSGWVLGGACGGAFGGPDAVVDVTDSALLLLRAQLGDCYGPVTGGAPAAVGAEGGHLAL